MAAATSEKKRAKANGAHPPAVAAQLLDTWDEDDFWSGCHLTTYMTEPPLHELKLPGGQILRCRTAVFFDAARFTVAFVDALGTFPPLPKRNGTAFLVDKFKGWLEDRTTVAVEEEHRGDSGALYGDIRACVLALPETDDPRDMMRGAVYASASGEGWINARVLMEQVRRVCPVKVKPADFYLALAKIGARNLIEPQVVGSWRGRAWALSTKLRPNAVVATTKTLQLVAAPVPPPEPEADQATFADYLESEGIADDLPAETFDEEDMKRELIADAERRLKS